MLLAAIRHVVMASVATGSDVLNREREGLVFMLWGSYAQKKGAIVDTGRHCVLRTTHPSPLSAHGGFLGCGHFSKANRYLARRGQVPIDWALPMRAQLEAMEPMRLEA